jgi:hypothetical protein
MTEEPKHIIRPNGTQEWCLNGKLHREGGPAYISRGGTRSWWVNGKRHRLEGPAVIRFDTYQSWYINGKRHRLDGPAIIEPDGDQEWWVNGKEITDEVISWMQQQGVTWPWDEETQMQFVLTFG